MTLRLEPKCHCARKGPAVGNSIKSPWRRRPRRFPRVSSCARPQAAVPAVSMARRRIERLQGVQFCRHTMEIRSEVSGPPDCVRGAWTEKEAFVRLLIFGSGGLGLRRRDGGKAEDSVIYRCSRGAFIHDFHRRTSKATAGSARTRLGN